MAARWTGMRWPDAFALGALMNTRGLMELIALVTTAMTGPLLAVAGRWQRA
jgi:Kef-type K+ transport system membrane component KefB